MDGRINKQDSRIKGENVRDMNHFTVTVSYLSFSRIAIKESASILGR